MQNSAFCQRCRSFPITCGRTHRLRDNGVCWSPSDGAQPGHVPRSTQVLYLHAWMCTSPPPPWMCSSRGCASRRRRRPARRGGRRAASPAKKCWSLQVCRGRTTNLPCAKPCHGSPQYTFGASALRGLAALHAPAPPETGHGCIASAFSNLQATARQTP